MTIKTERELLSLLIAEAAQLEIEVAALRAELAEARGPGPAAIYQVQSRDLDHGHWGTELVTDDLKRAVTKGTALEDQGHHNDDVLILVWRKGRSSEMSVTLADAPAPQPRCRACSGERGRFENGPGHTDYWVGCDVCGGVG